MNESLRQRCLAIGGYIVENRATVRQAAAHFGLSKSSIHKDMTEKLPEMDTRLARRVRWVLDWNKAERHLRGGQATKAMYARIKGQ